MAEKSKGKLKVYKSSAGSGKTYTLAKEYIKILLSNREVDSNTYTENYFRHILAITFTNDAANEMKDRVLRYLRDFSQQNEQKENGLLQQIISEINEEYPHQKISVSIVKERSDIILKSILHRFSDFNIQTIDSFTNQIARSFARELGLPGNYEIYLDTKIKLAESVDILLSRIDEKEKLLLNWLFDFVKNRIDDDRSWNIAYNLKDFSTTLTDENVYEMLESLKEWNLEDFNKAKNELLKEYSRISEQCRKLAKEGLDYLDSENLDHAVLNEKKNGVRSLFEKNIKEPFSKDLGKNLYKHLQNNDWLKKEANPKNNFDDVNTNISIIAGKMHEFFEVENGRFISLKNILINFPEMALLNNIKSILEELKEKDDQAFLSDLNEKIRDVVLSEPIPFIYEKAGVRFKHLLIDEFQDTSVFQWINLIPLLSNALSEGKVNLIVGDVKQSIYRWRGADPDILVNLPESKDELSLEPIREHALSLKSQVEINPLNSNWRSNPGIIYFNNSFFEWLKENNEEFKGLGNYYDDVIQKAEKNGDSDIRIDVLTEKEFQNKDEMQDFKSNLVIEYIDQCINAGYAWKDIAILCRKNNEIKNISSALVEKQISIISDESLLLESSTAVKVLIKVFEFLNEPGNQDTLADLFIQIANLKDLSIDDWTEIQNKIKLKSAEDYVDFVKDFFNLEIDETQLIEGSVFQLGQAWIKALRMMKDTKQQVYLDYFLDVLFEFSNKPITGLGQFLEYWEDKKERLSISSTRDQNAIRVSTIHKAKGMEYPVVIIPYPELNYSMKKGSKAWIELPKSFETELPVAVLGLNAEIEKTEFSDFYFKEKKAKFIEEVNALFVAMTRAKEGLYLIASIPNRKNMSNFIVDFLEGKQYINSEKKYQDVNYLSYTIETQKDQKDLGIEAAILPWDNAKNRRERIQKNLRWSVDFTLSKEQINSIQSGKSFHLLMSYFKTESDLQKVIKIASELFQQKEFEDFQNFLRMILSDLEMKSYFQNDWKIYNERSVIYEGEILRPDRFQIRDNRVVIIDYKTGLQNEMHQSQIDKYQKALADVYSNYQIAKYIIYSKPFKIVSLS
ncbi:UvrD-helicase domain-containing protein [Hyphobacterium sp. CCMP332]|nr:UvrD-helicase domain-containing protein [Hyphobacterium sp. CCMP332]